MNQQIIQEQIKTGIDLRTKGMLVTLHLHCYTARKYDKKVTRDTNRDHDASMNAGRYNKQLIDVEKYLSPIRKLQSEIRDYHYTMSLPWLEGARVLSLVHWEPYCQQMNQYLDQHAPLVQAFLSVYPQAQQEAQSYLGKMYNQDEYPSVEQVALKFYAEYLLTPLPSVQDFRIDLPEYAIAKTAQAIESAYQRATRDAWQRLHDHIEHIARKMQEFETGDSTRLYDSMLSNLEDLIRIMPGLNMQDDPVLQFLAESARRRLTAVPVEVLREDESARKRLKTEAQDILAKMRFHLPAEC